MSLNSGGRRVVVTGMGIVSCIGNDLETVTGALRDSRPGIRADPVYAEMGLRSQVSGVPQLDLEALIDRKLRRFMGDAAAYAYVALRDAIAQSGLDEAQVSNPRTGLGWLTNALRCGRHSRRRWTRRLCAKGCGPARESA